ncbi:trehalose-phosphatase [soil metagenome]
MVTVPPQAGDLLAPLLAAPRRAGVLTDFDGTLAPIVDDPDQAQLLDGVADALGALARRYRRVAVISGRPVDFLQPHLPRRVVVSGLYGLEVIHDGRRTDHPMAGAWREVITDVASLSAARGPTGMRVETKGLSITLHYRTRPELEEDVRAWAEHQGARAGLRCRRAKMSFELHPPIDADKGTALLRLAKGLESLVFIGDDMGDLPAFDALDGLAGEGRRTVKVAVRSDEVPAELVERADLVVDGPEGAGELLRMLLSAPR